MIYNLHSVYILVVLINNLDLSPQCRIRRKMYILGVYRLYHYFGN